VDSAKAGLKMTFFVQIALASSRKSSVDEFLDKVENLGEVVECHHITGSGNFLLKVVTRDLMTFQRLIMDGMSSLQEITNLESMVVLSCVKDSKVMPIPVD
jgi:DNA-binding Lrp family transcriptional regulator